MCHLMLSTRPNVTLHDSPIAFTVCRLRSGSAARRLAKDPPSPSPHEHSPVDSPPGPQRPLQSASDQDGVGGGGSDACSIDSTRHSASDSHTGGDIAIGDCNGSSSNGLHAHNSRAAASIVLSTPAKREEPAQREEVLSTPNKPQSGHTQIDTQTHTTTQTNTPTVHHDHSPFTLAVPDSHTDSLADGISVVTSDAPDAAPPVNTTTDSSTPAHGSVTAQGSPDNPSPTDGEQGGADGLWRAWITQAAEGLVKTASEKGAVALEMITAATSSASVRKRRKRKGDGAGGGKGGYALGGGRSAGTMFVHIVSAYKVRGERVVRYCVL